jgi:hypothetical protein
MSYDKDFGLSVDFDKLNELAMSNVKDNLTQYYRAHKSKMPEHLPYDSASRPYGVVTTTAPVVEYVNYLEIEPYTLPEDTQDTLVNTTIKLAREVGYAVEFLIRKEAQRDFGVTRWRDRVTTMRVTDLFERTDGSPNLVFQFVANAPISVIDPLQSVPGWVSYRFKFAILL